MFRVILHLWYTSAMNDKKTDARVIKTKQRIEMTFLKLLDEMPFEKLTTSLIIKECLISIGTFYAHYSDKYDLAEQLLDRELEVFESLLTQRFESAHPSLDQLSEMVTQAFQESQVFSIYEKINLPNRHPFDLELRSIYQKAYLQRLQQVGYQGNATLQAFLFSAVAMTYIAYVRQGNDSLSLTELVTELDQFFEHLQHSFSNDTR